MGTGFDQELADRLDGMTLAHPLSAEAVSALAAWAADPAGGARYRDGTGPHAFGYAPPRWAAVPAWPDVLADRTPPESAVNGAAAVSRADVVSAFRSASRTGDWLRALVASMVWGYGRTGYGPCRARRILREPGLADTLADTVRLLTEKGATDAYDRLLTVRRLGAAFGTKFLYFAGQALPSVQGPSPLILDRVLARALRAHAIAAAPGHPWAAATAGHIWRDGGWTSHRYGVYLTWMHATHRRLAATVPGWPTAPDTLELALFTGAHRPRTPKGAPPPGCPSRSALG